jgi:alpha/beta superfamily hydrolase
MRVDETYLSSLRRREDTELGISEEFVPLVLNGASTFGVVTRPLGRAHPVAWVLCHSFGIEQIHLGRLDVIAARALSAAGFTTLRYHGHGYGDSQGDMRDITLTSHLKDAETAVGVAARQDGVERVGVAGARLGGMVAALVADREGLDLMALWEPAVRGSQYMRDFLRTRLFSELVASERKAPSDVHQIHDDLATRGWADINGFPLSARAYDEISAVDLTKDLERFRGSALVVGISRSGQAGPALTALQARLRDLGAVCTLQVLKDPLAAQFGQFRFQTVAGGRSKRDTQLELNELIAKTTADWSAQAMREPQSGSEPRS